MLVYKNAKELKDVYPVFFLAVFRNVCFHWNIDNFLLKKNTNTSKLDISQNICQKLGLTFKKAVAKLIYNGTHHQFILVPIYCKTMFLTTILRNFQHLYSLHLVKYQSSDEFL